MVEYEIRFTKSAVKNIPNIKTAGLSDKVKKLLDIIRVNPYQNPPSYEKLVGNMSGLYFRRINIQHRLAYQVYEEEKIIKVVSVWSHYEY